MSTDGPVSALRLALVRREDGGTLLRCTRAGGSVSWQHQPPAHAPHFVAHDLTHYAVETTLGARRAFFGLVAEGWEIDETTGKGARGPLPDEALWVERIVGLLDAERASGADWTAATFAEQLARVGARAPASLRPLDDAALSRIRRRRDELLAAWRRTPLGEELALHFPPELHGD